MANWPPHLLAFFVALLALAGIITLAALSIAIPDILTEAFIASLAGGLGLAIPASSTSSSTTSTGPPTTTV
jgi:hypothetical protein